MKFPATLPVKELWGDKVGGGKKQVKLRLGLGPAVDNGTGVRGLGQGRAACGQSGDRAAGLGEEIQACRSPPAPARALGMVVVGIDQGLR